MKTILRAISWRRLKEHKLRTFLTVLGIGLGVSAYLAVTMITQTLSDSFSSMVDLVSGKVSLQVTGGPTGVEESILDQIKKVPGVKAAVPVIQAYSKTADGQGLLILAVDTLNDKAVRDFKMQDSSGAEISDPLVFLNTPNAILLNKEFAQKNNITVDSSIQLLTSKGKLPFIVRGLLDPKGTAETFGGRFGLMDVFSAQQYFSKEKRFDSIDVLVEDRSKINSVKDRIYSALGGKYTIQRPEQRTENVENLLSAFRSGMELLSLVVLLMGMFIIYNTVYTSVYQRKREIGVLRMIGLTRSGIIALYCLEGLIMGSVGSAIGIVGGYYMGSFSVHNFAASVTSFYLTVDTSHATFNGSIAMFGMFMGVGASLIASLYPAWRASTFTPMEVVRYGVGLSYGAGVTLGRFAIILAVMLIALSCGLFLPGIKNNLNGVRLAMVGTTFASIAATPMFMLAILVIVRKLDFVKGNSLRKLASQNILRDLSRASMTVAAFMISLAVMYDVYLFVHSMKSEIKSWLDEVLRADLFVTSSSSFANRMSIPVEGSLSEKMSRIEGVAGVTRVRQVQVDYGSNRIMIFSLELNKFLSSRWFKFAADAERPSAIDALSRGEGVFLTQNLIYLNPRLNGAEKITLKTPTGDMDFKVLGTIIDYVSQTGAVFMERKMFVKYFHDELADSFQVYVKPDADIFAVRKRIYDLLGQDFNLYVLTNREFKISLLGAIDQMFTLAYSLELIAILIAFIGIVNNLMATVMDRTREIGVLRAIGSTKGQIAKIFVTHAGLLGLSGALLSILSGFALGIIHVQRMTLVNTGWVVKMQFSWAHIAAASFVAFVVGIVAGFLPARSAANLPMHEALKYE